MTLGLRKPAGVSSTLVAPSDSAVSPAQFAPPTWKTGTPVSQTSSSRKSCICALAQHCSMRPPWVWRASFGSAVVPPVWNSEATSRGPISRAKVSASPGCGPQAPPRNCPRLGRAAADAEQHRRVGQLAQRRLDLGPQPRHEIRIGRQQHPAARLAQQRGDLMRLQQEIDGIGEAGGLRADHGDEALRQQRQQHRNRRSRLDAERAKQVGRLRHARKSSR